MFRGGRAERGSAMVVTLIVGILIALIGFAMLALNGLNDRMVFKYNNQASAFQAAQSGIEDALYEIYENDPTDPMVLHDEDPWTEGFDFAQVPQTDSKYYMTFDQNNQYFSVNNLYGTTDINGYFGEGRVPPNTAQLISVGTSDDHWGARAQSKIFVSLTWRRMSIWDSMDAVLLADVWWKFNGNAFADSFNSEVGTYAQTRVLSDANVRTNGYAEDIARLIGNAWLYGDVILGPGSVVSTTLDVGPNAGYSGLASVAEKRINLPSMTLPEGISPGGNGNVLPPGVYDSLNVTGKQVVKFTSGVYVFTGRLMISGQGKIEINPANNEPCIIFCDDELDAHGLGIVNNSLRSRLCIILATDNCEDMAITGNAWAYYGVYAPKARVHLVGNGDFFGGLVCSTFENFGNGSLHRDMGLSGAPPYFGRGADRLGWMELSTE